MSVDTLADLLEAVKEDTWVRWLADASRRDVGGGACEGGGACGVFGFAERSDRLQVRKHKESCECLQEVSALHACMNRTVLSQVCEREGKSGSDGGGAVGDTNSRRRFQNGSSSVGHQNGSGQQ